MMLLLFADASCLIQWRSQKIVFFFEEGIGREETVKDRVIRGWVFVQFPNRLRVLESSPTESEVEIQLQTTSCGARSAA